MHVCTYLCVSTACMCVFLRWFPVTVRRGEASLHLTTITWDTFHRPRPLPLPISFTCNVGDMRAQGCDVGPMCCCSVRCIIHGMTGSGMADGRRGFCVKTGGGAHCKAISVEGAILILTISFESNVTQKISTKRKAQENCLSYHTARVSHPNYLSEAFPLFSPQSFPE